MNVNLPSKPVEACAKPTRNCGVASAASRKILMPILAVVASGTVGLSPANVWAAYSPTTCAGLKGQGLDDTQCRSDQLKDINSGNNNAGNFAPGSLQSNVPVAVMGDEYARETVELGNKIILYGQLDLYSKERVELVKTLKTDMNTWVGKYARGGSARKESARKMYIAVDALTAHFAQNGLAPLPKFKFDKIEADVCTTFAYLEQDR